MTTYFKALLFPAMLIVLFSFISTPVHAEPKLIAKVNMEFENICKDVTKVKARCRACTIAGYCDQAYLISWGQSTAESLNSNISTSIKIDNIVEGKSITDARFITCSMSMIYKNNLDSIQHLANTHPDCVLKNSNSVFESTAAITWANTVRSNNKIKTTTQ